jgi:hypothetical protein
MSDNPILDEVYAARRAVFEEAGGTLDRFCAHYSRRRPGILYAETPQAEPRRSRKRSPRIAARKKATSVCP